jgi:hypothetical protein
LILLLLGFMISRVHLTKRMSLRTGVLAAVLLAASAASFGASAPDAHAVDLKNDRIHELGDRLGAILRGTVERGEPYEFTPAERDEYRQTAEALVNQIRASQLNG